MRTLTWYIPGTLGPATDVGPAFRLDDSYTPRRVWVQLGGMVQIAQPLIIDIKVDGESIFSLRPTLQQFEGDVVEEGTFSVAQFSKDSVVTLDVVQGGRASNMTVGLELDEA